MGFFENLPAGNILLEPCFSGLADIFYPTVLDDLEVIHDGPWVVVRVQCDPEEGSRAALRSVLFSPH